MTVGIKSLPLCTPGTFKCGLSPVDDKNDDADGGGEGGGGVNSYYITK